MAESVRETIVYPKSTLRNSIQPLRMGVFSVLVFAVASISLASSGLTPFSSLAGMFPGTNLTLLLTVGMGICLVLGFTYAVIGTAVHRSGADYVLVSRVIHPSIGFAFSFTTVVFCSQIAGFILAKAGEVTIPVLLRSIAIIGNAPGMLLSADFIASPQGISITGSVAVGLAFVIAILPPRTNLRILQVGFFLLLLSWGLVFFMLINPSGGFQANWDRFMGEGSFLTPLAAARDSGMVLDNSSRTMVFAGLLAAMWIFFGFQAPAYIAGDVKKPGRSLLLGSLGAIFISWLVIGLASYLIQSTVSSEWISAQSFLALNGLQTSPWLNFYVAIARPDPILVSIFSVMWLVSLLNMAQAFFIFTSRIILAWCEDGLLPTAVGYVHPQLKSPIVAVLLIAILAQIGVWLVATGGGSSSADYYFLFFAVFIQVPSVLAVILVPFTRRDWFLSTGKLANLRLGPLPVVSIAGFASLVYFGGMIAYGFLDAHLSQAVLKSLILLLLLVLTGVTYFVIRRRSYHQEPDPFRSFPPPVE